MGLFIHSPHVNQQVIVVGVKSNYYGSNNRKISCDWYIDDRNMKKLQTFFIRMCRKTPSLSYGDIRHVHRIYASN